jgi:glycosyltransferase involved in cell wall biosynthesis
MRRDALRSAPIRVLQLGSPNGLFGAERWILALARHLPADSIETIVGVIQDVEGASEAPLLAEARGLGMETLSITAPGRVNAASVRALRAMLRERRIDVLHTHFYKSTIVGALAVRGTDCRLLATPHGWNTGAGVKLQAYEWAERVAFGWADAIAPLSADLERGLRRLPWVRGRLTLISNGVDLDEVGASSAVETSVQAARSAGEFVVGYIGQLIERKRVDTLIDAFASLRVDARRMFIVGDGDQRARLEARAAERGVGDRVHFTGFRDDRLELLRGFDALVLPSTLEGIPRCLMEAMAAGVAVVATDIAGTRDLVVDGQSGLLFPVGDSRSLAAALEAVQGDDGLRNRLVTAGSARVNEYFSARAMAMRYARLFETLRAGAPGVDFSEPVSGRAD